MQTYTLSILKSSSGIPICVSIIASILTNNTVVSASLYRLQN